MTWSLRRRLAAAAALAATGLVVVAGLLLLTEAWRRSNVDRVRDVDLLADEVDRDLAAAGSVEALGLDGDELVALFDEDGAVVEAANVDEAVIEEFAAVDLDLGTVEDFEVVSAVLPDRGSEWEVAGVTCTDPDRCDTLVVGRRPVGWWAYVRSRLPALAGVTVAVAAVAGAGAWILVGRSLRPVERMRRELDEITGARSDRRIDVPPSGDELAALAVSMNATVDRLDEALVAQRRFVSDAAHELRSPLTGLRATFELAQRDPDRAPQAIVDAIGQVDRTSDLVDDLLELARRDTSAAERRTTDVDDVVRDEVAEARRRWPGVSISAPAVEPVQVEADPGGLVRVVRNLVDNAAAVASVVEVRLSTGAGWWVLLVDDDGPGVPPSQRQAVFERFRRLDESRSRHTGGSGLGLAIVAAIVASHGGQVAITDAPLGGARLTVRVPVAA